MAPTVLSSSGDEAQGTDDDDELCPPAEPLADVLAAEPLADVLRSTLEANVSMGGSAASSSHAVSPCGVRVDHPLSPLAALNSEPTGSTGMSGASLLERVLKMRSGSSSGPGSVCQGDDKENDGRATNGDVPMVESQAAPRKAPTKSKPASLHDKAPAAVGSTRRLHPETMGDDALKAWMAFFGMKPVSSREFMLKRLTEIDGYLSREPAMEEQGSQDLVPDQALAAPPVAAPGPALPKRRGRPKKRARSLAGAARAAGAEASGGPDRDQDAVATPAWTRARKADAPDDARPDQLGDAVAASQTARQANAAAKAARLEQLAAEVIRSDTELYERLLLFEPVELTELRERLAAVRPELRGLGEQRLRKFLDAQGLLFSSAWSQGGRQARKRP